MAEQKRLDRPELRKELEKIVSEAVEILDDKGNFLVHSGLAADQILALIEEAIIQARKEQMVVDWAQAGKDVEEVKKQERERIARLFKKADEETDSTKYLSKVLYIISELEQALGEK